MYTMNIQIYWILEVVAKIYLYIIIFVDSHFFP